MSTKIETSTMAQRLAKIVAAGVIASAMCAPMAFAADGRTGDESAAQTDLVMRFVDEGEYGQSNGNLKFTVPTTMNYTAKASGELKGTATYIENDSSFPIHVSSMLVSQKDGWNIVESAAGVTTANAVDVTFVTNMTDGDNPTKIADKTSDSISAHTHMTTDTKAITNKAGWKMSAKADSTAETALDRVKVASTGHVNNLTNDITSNTTFGTVQWYVTVGAPASA